MLTATSTARTVVLSLALLAAGGSTLFFGIMHERRELPVKARDATAARSTVGTAALADPHRSRDTGNEFTPVFDIARIEPAGDAVIAGRAAPGGSVELLRNGKVHDRAIADRSGQFVMIPPRLPPGDYELTLRSRRLDGKEATSKQSVAVGLQPSLKDQTVMAPMTLDKASIVVSKSVAHPAAGGKKAVPSVSRQVTRFGPDGPGSPAPSPAPAL
jgi:hypothetical protein